MTKIRITCEIDVDFNEKATDDFKRRTVQGVVDNVHNVHSRQLTHALLMCANNLKKYKEFQENIDFDTKIAKQISENSKVEIIKLESDGNVTEVKKVD